MAEPCRKSYRKMEPDDLQPCGHPEDARVCIPDDLGGDRWTSYCSICNAEAEAEVRRDDRMNTDLELNEPMEMREEEMRY